MANSHQDSLIKELDYKVPVHANTIFDMFGGISLVAFIILAVSGAYLAQFYNPTTEAAHASIVYAITNIPLADFMRSLHFWVANLVIVLLLLHIGRVFITGAYKKPRRLTWLTGVALLAVTITYIFVGTTLKWDQEGVEAFGHMQESFNLFGVHIGLTNGGVPVITQLYSWHTTILGIFLVGLLVVHMLLIKLRGIAGRPLKHAVATVTEGHGSSHFLIHLRRLAGFGLIFVGLSALLAVIFPAPIGQPGILEQEVTKPLWMFWPFYGLEDIFGLKGLVWGMVGFFAFLVIVPFIDRNPYLHFSKRKFVLSLGALFMAVVIGLGVYSRVHPPEAHIEEMSETDIMEMASPKNLNVSHQRLHNEALYLVPTAIVIGSVGGWLAFKSGPGRLV